MTIEFFAIFNFKIYWLAKKKYVKEFSASTHGIQDIAQTWSCESIILLYGHLGVQLKSHWTVNERLLASDQPQSDNVG